jgi:hypothetical protein
MTTYKKTPASGRRKHPFQTDQLTPSRAHVLWRKE